MKIFLILLSFCLSYSIFGQHTGIGTNDPTAVLHLKSDFYNQEDINETFESGTINPNHLAGSHIWMIESDSVYLGNYSIKAPSIGLPTTGAALKIPFFLVPGKTGKLSFYYHATFDTPATLTYQTSTLAPVSLAATSGWIEIKENIIASDVWQWDTLYINYLPSAAVIDPEVYIDHIYLIGSGGHSLRIDDGAQGDNYVLVSDVLGNAHWADILTEINDSLATAKQTLDFQDKTLSISNGNTVEINALKNDTGELWLNTNRRLSWGQDNHAAVGGTTAWGSQDTVTGIWGTAWGYLNKVGGNNATAWGGNNTSNGLYTTAWGASNLANGPTSTAWGTSNDALGQRSTAFGFANLASGKSSTAFGEFTIANAFLQTSLGRYNDTISTGDPLTWQATDQLFVIGNGSGSNFRNNALEILKNGKTTIDHLIIDPATHQITWGYENMSIGNYSTAWGQLTTASGDNATAWGGSAVASGSYATSWGTDNRSTALSTTTWGADNDATFYNATAWGAENIAANYNATAFGYQTEVKGEHATALGWGSQAYSQAMIALGRFNQPNPLNDQYTWINGDDLFVIGNGTDNANRRNAFTLLKNGNTGIGIEAPTEALQVAGKMQSVGAAGQLANMGVFELDGGTLFGFEFEYDGTTDLMHLWSRGFSGNEGKRMTFTKSGNVGIKDENPTYDLELPNSSTDGTARAFSWTTYSDARVKKNVQDLEIGLKEILQLRPKSYDHHSANFKGGQLEVLEEREATIGLLAQEVHEIIPGIVFQPEDEQADLWSLDYEKIIPVLIKAIQEQEAERQSLESRIEVLEKLILQQQGIMAELAE